jgi:hypothetical protein
MRYFIWSVFFVTLNIFFIACKKDNAKNNSDISTSIVGSWELRQAQTGMIPTINYPSGNGDVLKFTNSDYQVFSNNQLIKSGLYTIVEDTSAENEVCLVIAANQFRNRIIYDGNSIERKIFIQISNNKLTFLTGCFALDGGSYKEYERQQDDL